MPIYRRISFASLFRFLCLLTTLSMCIYWCYKFSMNEEKSVINYKTFSVTSPDAIFPTLSLCFENPFLKSRLAEYGTDEKEYLSFLSGNYFDEKMLGIDYNMVTKKITDYIKGYEIYFNNFTRMDFSSIMVDERKESWISNNFNGLIQIGRTGFFRCFSFDIPKIKDLRIFRVKLSNEMFRNGVRPTSLSFMTYLHLPNQFLVPSFNYKWTWPKRSKYEWYRTRIIVRSFEVERRRNAKGSDCSESWKNYDDWVFNRLYEEIGCRSPYHIRKKGSKMCESKDKIHRSYFHYQRPTFADRKYPKPCLTMENVRMEFDETFGNDWTIGNETIGNVTNGYSEFLIGIYFHVDSYKEILNTR